MSNQFIVHGIHRATTEEDMAVVVIFTPNTYTDSIYASDPIGVKIVLWVWGEKRAAGSFTANDVRAAIRLITQIGDCARG